MEIQKNNYYYGCYSWNCKFLLMVGQCTAKLDIEITNTSFKHYILYDWQSNK